MKLPHVSTLTAMLFAGVLASHAPGASALPDHGLRSVAGTAAGANSADSPSMAKVIGPVFSASAQTGYGANRARSMAASSNAVAYAGSLWWDRYTISGGMGEGAAGFSAVLNGSLGAANSAGAGVGYVLVVSSALPASLEFDFSALTATNVSNWLEIRFAALGPPATNVLAWHVDGVSGTPLVAGKSISETFSGSFGFTYDTPFYIGAALVTAAGSISGTATADFFNTATFELTLAAGDTLAVASVPEPGEWALLLAGLGLIGLRLKRRRAQVG